MLDCMLVGFDWIELIGTFGMSSEDDRFGLQISRNFTVRNVGTGTGSV